MEKLTQIHFNDVISENREQNEFETGECCLPYNIWCYILKKYKICNNL